jgi:N-acetylneuraminic acid mutarotase
MFVGGRRGLYPGTATREVWQYDTAANAWTPLAPLPEPLSAGAAEFLDGRVHYLGGNRGQERTADCDLHYVWGPRASAWHTAAPLPVARDHCSTAALAGRLYVFGGEIGHDVYHRQRTDACVYDPATDAWTALAAMPIGKSHAESSTFVLDGRVVIAGGQVDNYLATANVVEYDPAADAWALLPPLPRPLEGTIVQALGGRLFVTGGYIGTNSVATVASYTSTPFAGPPNAPVGPAARLVAPLGLAAVLMLSGFAATVVAAARRQRRVKGREPQPVKMAA